MRHLDDTTRLSCTLDFGGQPHGTALTTIRNAQMCEFLAHLIRLHDWGHYISFLVDWQCRGIQPQTPAGRTECRVPKNQTVVAGQLELINCHYNTI